MLRAYLERLYNTVVSRGDLEIELLVVDDRTSTHPHHKHVGPNVEPTQAPDLNEVLREIETFIYSSD